MECSRLGRKFIVRDCIDIELWQRFKNGEYQALSQIYKYYINSLFDYGVKICPDDALVKDSIQEVFIKLIDKRTQLVIGENIHVYIYKSLRNEILEALRSDRRKKNISGQIIPEDTHVSSIEQSIVRSEEELQTQRLIDQAIGQLTDYQREAIFLRYNQQFGYDEIAEMLGIDVASARTLVYRALKKVKEHLSVKTTILFHLLVGCR